MWIERVTARAFGPFAGETLELAPGLTVILGPNESGKTSWHAAIRSAVCGVRRGRGRATALDAGFEERHRPWDAPERWEVEARLRLDDGRTIEISQDLAGKVACRATDVGLGRDVSAEIMDGTPDASRWLGLDRDAFAATICVGQAQILTIANRDTAAALQEHMQRAAATRGTDATAAEARARIAVFRRDHVGLDRVGARGPLRAATTALDAAQATLTEARRQHVEYLEAEVQAEEANRTAGVAAHRIQAVESALARRQADASSRRAVRAAALAARYPGPPQGTAARAEHAGAVAAAIDAWTSRPRPGALTGTSSTEMERELASLPGAPDGDTQVDPTVAEARRQLDLAEEALRLQGQAPAIADAPNEGPAEEQLRTIARRLRTPEPEPVPQLEAELAAAHAQLGRRPGRALPVAVGGALFLLVAGIGALALGQPGVAAVMLVLGLGLAAWGWQRGQGAARVPSLRIAHAEAALAPVRAAQGHARRERAEATAEAAAAGLVADPDALEALADRRAAALRLRQGLDAWRRQRRELESRRAAAITSLRLALAAHGAEARPDDEVEVVYAAYAEACRRRAEQATLAGRVEGLRRALEARRLAEAGINDARQAASRTETALRAAARAAGVEMEQAAPHELVVALRDWQAEHSQQMRRAEVEIREWQELTALLDGRSVDDLTAEADARSSRADQLSTRVREEELSALLSRDDLEGVLAIEREELARLQRDADTRAGALEQMRRDLPDVAEAEEALAEASAEVSRVTELARVLDETLRLIRGAEERVHRDLAPILADAVRRWLPAVSGGAYLDVSVDPADLSVRVKDADSGKWRAALLLSEGTREQIYLLLRVAMAQHLVTTGETAPLLLDEVTAQADRQRAEQLLEVLRELSAERQVVLFTHDDEVGAWAERSLDSRRDRLVRLANRAQVPVVTHA